MKKGERWEEKKDHHHKRQLAWAHITRAGVLRMGTSHRNCISDYKRASAGIRLNNRITKRLLYVTHRKRRTVPRRSYSLAQRSITSAKKSRARFYIHIYTQSVQYTRACVRVCVSEGVSW